MFRSPPSPQWGRRGRRRPRESGRASRQTRSLAMEESEASDLSSLSNLSSIGYERLDLSKHTAPIKRLYKEYLEVRNNPLPNVSVAPLPNDFLEWHGNIRAPRDTLYNGAIFHFAIRFSERHPIAIPELVMKSRIEHPCVKGGRIKLDTLTDCTVKPTAPEKRYYYYTPGYTVYSILVQLHAILYEGTAEVALEKLTDAGQYKGKKEEFEAGVQFSVEQSLRYSCGQCKHRAKNYWPPLPEPDSVPPPVTTEDSTYSECLVCYLTRKTHKEAALGLGISFTKNVRTGHLQHVRCVSDIISLNAYNGAKMKEMWQHEFTHWIPIFLSSSKPDRASHLAKRTLSSIYRGSPTEFQPYMALDFFPKLLTHLSLSFVTETWYAAALRILRAYCYMHRLFLHFLQSYPELVQAAKEKVKQFVENPDMRSKEKSSASDRNFGKIANSRELVSREPPLSQHVPSLGELLCILAPAGVAWTDVSDAYTEESWTRNVLWVVKKHPELDTDKPDPKVDATRLSKTFAVAQTGMRYLMCQLMFNRLFAAKDGASIDSVASQYDEHCSLLPWRVVDEVWEERKAILEVKNYSEFHPKIGRPAPTDEKMLDLLRRSVQRSREKHYHGDKGIVVLSPEEFEKVRLGKIKSLDECVVKDHLHDDEEQWKEMCDTRFGLSELPDDYSSLDTPTRWKHLYLQHNLQELIGKLNDNPDFSLLYRTLALSKDTLTSFELLTFNPDRIKSGYFFLARILEGLPRLEHLAIVKGEAGLGEKGFKELVKGLAKSSGALKVLDMRHSEITTPCVRKLAESHLTSESLKVLNLEGNPLKTDGTKSLADLMMKHHSLPNLEELNLRKCQITDDGVIELARGLIVKRNIKKLSIGDNPFRYEGLAELICALAYNPVLEELEVTKLGNSSTIGVSNALAFLFRLTVSLKKINFWSTGIAASFNEDAMKALAKNKTIEELDLGSCGFGLMTEFSHVFASEHTKLRRLIAEASQLTLSGIECVNKAMEGRSCSLRELDLKQSKFLFAVWLPSRGTVYRRDEVVELISRSVSVSSCSSPISRKRPRTWEYSSEAKRAKGDETPEEKYHRILLTFFSVTLANVTQLNLSSCNVNIPGAEVLGNVLKKNTALLHLDLSFNSLGKGGMKQLAAGLMENTKLEYLRMDQCELGAAGAHYLAPVLARKECTLKELHVFCNYFEVPGVKAICEALCENRFLQVLDLGLNKVRKNGAAAVVKMLETNRSLKHLFLKFNYIPDVWALRIARTVAETEGCGIVELKLAGNVLQYTTIVSTVSVLKGSAREVQFDLASRADYLDPDKLERTIYVKPLAVNCTKEMLKKLFYSNNCGAITSVKLNMRRKKKGRRANFRKAQYAFVEFAHRDSVELAMDLVHKDKAYIRGSGQKLTIVRAGLGASATAVGGVTVGTQD